ncbi:MAG: hypothetical protein KC619_02140 [Myxococcales bacterium]|nr:hypothetical protein [Myxococcales bacterium]
MARSSAGGLVKMRKVKRKRAGKARRKTIGYSATDRERVLAAIDALLTSEETADAVGVLYDEYYGEVEDLPPMGDDDFMEWMESNSRHAFLFWACFDFDPEDDVRLVDRMLRVHRWSAGERAFLTAMRGTRMRLYEIEAVEPGASVTLRDVFDEGLPVKVRERSGSRTLQRGELLAARVMRPGASGQPEMDGGLFRYSELQRAHVLAAVEQELVSMIEYEPELSEDARWRELGPVLHEEWRTPRLPALVNYDGDPLVMTRVRFDVTEAEALEAALDAVSAD